MAMDVEFRKRVALMVFPIIYRDTDTRGNLVDDRARVAAKNTAEIAALLDNLINKETK